MSQVQVIIATLTSDGTGAATGSLEGLHGFVETIYIKHGATGVPDNNWELTIANSSLPAENILAETTIAATTSSLVVYRPIVLLQGTDGADLSAQYGRFLVAGKLSLTAANMGASKTADVTIVVEKLKG